MCPVFHPVRSRARIRRKPVDFHAAERVGRATCSEAGEAAASVFEGETRKGFVLRRAAPLVLSAACRKEGLSVRFTARPATDGKTVWLGPVDFSNPLAPVFVYGHGLHERGHVVYTDFSLLRGAARNDAPAALFEWANLFEDVRVDTLTMCDYAGYAILREALWVALKQAGLSRYEKDVPGRAPYVVLELYYLARLWERELGLGCVVEALEWLEADVRTILTESEKERLDRLVFEAWPLRSTADAVRLAQRVTTLLAQFAEELEPVRHERAETFESQSENRRDEAFRRARQPSLFDDDWGFGTPTAPEDEDAAVRRDRLLALLEGNGRERFVGQGRSRTDAASGLVALGETHATYEDGPCFRSEPWMRAERVEEALWPAETVIQAEGRKRFEAPRAVSSAVLFRETTAKLTGLASAFEDLFFREVPEPVGLTESGWDVDDFEIDRLAVGDPRVFTTWRETRGIDTALTILLDSSGSITEADFALVKATVHRLVTVLEKIPNLRISVHLFPGDTLAASEVVKTFGEPASHFAARVESRRSFGGTPVVTGLLRAAQDLVERPETHKALLVVTDGIFDRADLRGVPEDIESAGIELATLLVGRNETPDFGRHCLRAQGVADLSKVLRSLLRRMQWHKAP